MITIEEVKLICLRLNIIVPIEPDIDTDELKRQCSEYISHLEVTKLQQQAIAILNVHQANDPADEWKRQQHGQVTASPAKYTGEGIHALLSISFLFCKPQESATM